MKVYRRSVWNVLKDIFLTLLTPAIVYAALYFVLRYVQMDFGQYTVYIQFVPPGIVLLAMLYLTFVEDSTKFKLSRQGEFLYYKMGILHQTYDAETIEISYFNKSQVSGNTTKRDMSLQIITEDGRTDVIDCSPLGMQRTQRMLEAVDGFALPPEVVQQRRAQRLHEQHLASVEAERVREAAQVLKAEKEKLEVVPEMLPASSVVSPQEQVFPTDIPVENTLPPIPPPEAVVLQELVQETALLHLEPVVQLQEPMAQQQEVAVEQQEETVQEKQPADEVPSEPEPGRLETLPEFTASPVFAEQQAVVPMQNNVEPEFLIQTLEMVLAPLPKQPEPNNGRGVSQPVVADIGLEPEPVQESEPELVQEPDESAPEPVQESEPELVQEPDESAPESAPEPVPTLVPMVGFSQEEASSVEDAYVLKEPPLPEETQAVQADATQRKDAFFPEQQERVEEPEVSVETQEQSVAFTTARSAASTEALLRQQLQHLREKEQGEALTVAKKDTYIGISAIYDDPVQFVTPDAMRSAMKLAVKQSMPPVVNFGLQEQEGKTQTEVPEETEN